MPEVELDRCVVGVTHAAAGEDGHASAHESPAGLTHRGVFANKICVLLDGDSVWVSGGNVDGFAASSIDLVDHVRLTAAACDGFVAENQILIHDHFGTGNKEPFTLADEGIGAAGEAVAGADAFAIFLEAHFAWLERFHRSANTRDAGAIGYAGDEPVAFIVAAEEAVF